MLAFAMVQRVRSSKYDTQANAIDAANATLLFDARYKGASVQCAAMLGSICRHLSALPA
jgi:hypothetical protein